MRIPRYGRITIWCPVCLMYGDEQEKVTLEVYGGCPETRWEPSEPPEYDWVGGCKHLLDVSKFTEKQLAQIDDSVWNAIEEERRDALAGMAEAKLDRRREDETWRSESKGREDQEDY